MISPLLFACLSLILAVSGKSNSLDVNISYTVWVGDDVSSANSIKLEAPYNSFFFDSMINAANQDSSFAFEYQTFDFGRFVTSIGGVSQDSENNLYWRLYVLPVKPNVNHRPEIKYLANVGADALKVRRGYHYLFWLRT